jgi:putative molybdopterin biosynthesis protein
LSQLGKALGVTPARVRHHLVQLKEAGYVELVDTRPVRGFTEKYYQATSQAYWVNMALLPAPPPQGRVVVFASNDPALEMLADRMLVNPDTPEMAVYPIGSLNGLVALQQGLCQFSGCHLLNPEGEEYNTSYVRHFFPGQAMRVITLAHRQQGLMAAPKNPKGIGGLEDLAREEIVFINRNQGSGTRLWLDRQINELGLDAGEIKGYGVEVNTHAQVAEAVQQGSADVGVAVLAAALEAGLTFIPLFEERYDLVIPEDMLSSDVLVPALENLHTGEFRKSLETLGGYSSQDTGNEIRL